jgi:hypothetical protein
MLDSQVFSMISPLVCSEMVNLGAIVIPSLADDMTASWKVVRADSLSFS